MFAIVRAFVDITLLRQGPQYLPHSMALAVLALAVNAGLNLVSAPMQQVSAFQVFAAFVVGTVMMLSVIWLLLNAMQRRERYVQCITAMLGTDSILIVAELLVLVLVPSALATLLEGKMNGGSILLVAIGAWRIAVVSHILRQAMAVTVLQSLGIIVLIFLLYIGALGLLVPVLGLGGT